MAEVTEVLKLSTERLRRKIVIDGEDIGLADPGDISLAQKVGLMRFLKEISRLDEDPPKDENLVILEARLMETLGFILIDAAAHADKIEKLAFDQKIKIIVAFSRVPTEPAAVDASWTPARSS